MDVGCRDSQKGALEIEIPKRDWVWALSPCSKKPLPTKGVQSMVMALGLRLWLLAEAHQHQELYVCALSCLAENCLIFVLLYVILDVDSVICFRIAFGWFFNSLDLFVILALD